MSGEERLNELENRVSFLEKEVGTSLKQEQFVRSIELLAADEADVEFKQGRYENFARITSVNGDDVERIRQRIEKRGELNYAITETGSGLGVEVWSETDRKF